MAYYIAMISAGLIFLIAGLFRAAGRSDQHAEECYLDTAEQRTRQILITVRRQQARRSPLDRHLIISQMVRPRNRSVVDHDFEDLGVAG